MFKTFTRRTSIVIFVIILAIYATFALTSQAQAKTIADQPLTKAEIDARFAQIGNAYKEGELLSAEDNLFVEKYALNPNLPTPRTESWFEKSGYGYGTSVNFYGDIWHNGAFSYNWGGYLNGVVTAGPTPQSMTGTVKCQSFGGFPGGYFLEYNDTIVSSSYNSNSFYMNQSKSYAGIAAVYYVTTQLDVTTSGGQHFTVTG